MSMTRHFIAAGLLCMAASTPLSPSLPPSSFADEVAFLKRYVDVIVLSDRRGAAKVAVTAAWQGRVMTSTAGGDAGASFGWINRDLIVSRTIQPHINVFGGEDRFWLGPEGGQFSIFFAKGARFELADWQTPAPIDTMPFQVTRQSSSEAGFASRFTLTNYSGSRFDVAVDRRVRVLEAGQAWTALRVGPVAGVSLVAYESDNRITNAGANPWKKDTGLLSIWILGMFKPSPATTIVVPIRAGRDAELGAKVTSDYFGAVPADRLSVRDDVIYFSGDGRFRSKIGIGPRRSKGVLGSYDADNQVLTIVRFSQPDGVTEYVNSLWKIQDDPYGGDAANSYNDGPPAPGAKPLGPFYELESSSPAAALAPGASLSHVHRTIHLTGPEAALDAVARLVLGVGLADTKTALQTGTGPQSARQDSPNMEGAVIRGTLTNWKSAPGIRGLERAFEYLASTDLTALALGRTDVLGDDMYVTVSEAETRPPEQVKFEAHRRYIDIQLVIRGQEAMGFAPAAALTTVEPYDPARDIEFFAVPPTSGTVPVRAGEFVVFTPETGHRPSLHLDGPHVSRKAVVKVSVAYRDRQRAAAGR
jgi:YhcH/YjgK/YiaL family protein